MADASNAKKKQQGAIGIKETLSSLIIAFMLAFLFRGFVIEGFQIPTGSMAPTLLGKHIRFQGEQSGYNWETGPWTYQDPRTRRFPSNEQVDMILQDPMSGMQVTDTNRRLAAGDRVFVLKYLPLLHHPERWDVVVFKNPGQHINYIKRLIGLPGEQLAVVDGDVFTRPYVEGQTATSGWDAWTKDDWQVQRKPERVQRAMLQEVFDSSYAPVEQIEYRSPFTGIGAGWDGVGTGREYAFDGSGSTTLRWNDRRPITDFNAYNQTLPRIDLFASSDDTSYPDGVRPFPTSDLALSCNIRSQGGGVVASPTITARGMELRAQIDLGAGSASVMMRDATSADSPWTELDSGSFGPVGEGGWAHVEFWHIDQALWVFIDGELVAGGAEQGAYEWTPAQRASAATAMSWQELEDYPDVGDGVSSLGVFHKTELYVKPEVRWDFEGGPFELTHVRVQRDISYHIHQRVVTRGAHPNNFPTMTGEQFFMCGDNSSNSEDSRLWRDNDINAWVRQEIDDAPGVVNRDLVVGKAFVVYFPAPLHDSGGAGKVGLFSIDFGRLRWIW
ncbi:MAG: S26 family signal peptidase [Phycisphaerales bacterium]